jgi:hypothetical protein
MRVRIEILLAGMGRIKIRQSLENMPPHFCLFC